MTARWKMLKPIVATPKGGCVTEEACDVPQFTGHFWPLLPFEYRYFLPLMVSITY